jgi:hypothetical protein
MLVSVLSLRGVAPICRTLSFSRSSIPARVKLMALEGAMISTSTGHLKALDVQPYLQERLSERSSVHNALAERGRRPKGEVCGGGVAAVGGKV